MNKREQITRYSVTDIMTHACPGKLCHEHDVIELESDYAKLQAENESLGAELLRAEERLEKRANNVVDLQKKLLNAEIEEDEK